MQQSPSPKPLEEFMGVNVSECGVVELTKESFKDVDLEKYPDQAVHLLTYALQHQLKLPRPQTIERTDRRNKDKIAERKGFAKPDRKKKPKKEDPDKALKAESRKNGAIRTTAGSVPNRLRSQNSSLSSNLGPEQMKKDLNELGDSSLAVKIKSPQQIALKAARQEIQAKVAEWREEQKKEKEENPQAQSKLPNYFRKKHRSHKRRMKQRRQLVNENKDYLVEIFGADVLKKECRLGLKEIRSALGIKESGKQANLGEFMAMAEEAGKKRGHSRVKPGQEDDMADERDEDGLRKKKH